MSQPFPRLGDQLISFEAVVRGIGQWPHLATQAPRPQGHSCSMVQDPDLHLFRISSRMDIQLRDTSQLDTRRAVLAAGSCIVLVLMWLEGITRETPFQLDALLYCKLFQTWWFPASAAVETQDQCGHPPEKKHVTSHSFTVQLIALYQSLSRI